MITTATMMTMMMMTAMMAMMMAMIKKSRAVGVSDDSGHSCIGNVFASPGYKASARRKH